MVAVGGGAIRWQQDDIEYRRLAAAASGQAYGASEPLARLCLDGLAEQSKLNGWELRRGEMEAADRYKKVEYDAVAMDRLLVDIFLEAHQSQRQARS